MSLYEVHMKLLLFHIMSLIIYLSSLLYVPNANSVFKFLIKYSHIIYL